MPAPASPASGNSHCKRPTANGKLRQAGIFADFADICIHFIKIYCISMSNNRIVLVTGGTGGLGAAMCKELHKDGYRVAANYRNLEKAEATQRQLREEGVDIHLFEGDVTDYDSVGRMIATIEDTLGPVDVLVNNAGITRDGRFSKMSLEEKRPPREMPGLL